MDCWKSEIVHAFRGQRFAEGALDVEVVGWLSAYRELVLDVARSVWWRRNRDRKRLPGQFDRGFVLRLSRLERGCALATLERSAPVGHQLTLEPADDTFTSAMRLVEEAVRSADAGQPLPSAFPRTALPKFRKWGSSFLDDESVELRTPEGTCLASYTPVARAALLARIDTSFENAADELGFVLATSIRAGRFELYRDLHSGDGVDVPLLPEHEEQVLQALSSHGETRLRVVGTGAYGAEGRLVRFTHVERVELANEPVDNAHLWNAIDAISAGVPDEVWSTLPTDAAENHDAYL